MRRRLGLLPPSAAIWKANAPGIGRGTETGHRRVPAMIARVELAVLHTDVGDEVRIKLWGYNLSFTRLTHATAAVAALKRGMRLISSGRSAVRA